MSENSNHSKNRSLWGRYRGWLAGLTRGQRIRFRLLTAAAVVALLAAAVILFWQSWAKMPELPGPEPVQKPSSSQEDGRDLSDLPDIAQSGRKEGIYTFLLAGKDVASGGTDTILLMTYDANQQRVYGLNLPRDTMINTEAAAKRINAVYSRNRGSSDLPDKERVELGMAALKAEVAKHTGITPDFYILVEWKAIGELVDALGGVEFEVPFLMDYTDPYQDLYIYQEPGLRVLDGEDAMQVIRFRKNNSGSVSLGDVGRLEIQQDFLKAVAKKCLHPTTFLKIPDLARIFTENVTTDLTVGNIMAFAQSALGMDPEEGVTFRTAPLAASFFYNKAALVTLDGKGVLEIVNNGMNPYLRDIEMGDLELVYQKSDGSLGVLNGTVADPAITRVPEPVIPEEPVEPVDPEEPIDPEEPVEGDPVEGDPVEGGDSSQTGDGSQTGDSSQTGEEPVTDPTQTGDGDTTDPTQPQEPVQSGDGSQTQEGSSSQTGDSGLDVTIDPEQVLPDPTQQGGDQPTEPLPEEPPVDARAA